MDSRILQYIKVNKKKTPIENYSEHQQILNKWFKFFNKKIFYKIAVAQPCLKQLKTNFGRFHF